jgi:hypothetical protein
MVHAPGVQREKPLGLERNGGQETVEAEEELYEETKLGDEHE